MAQETKLTEEIVKRQVDVNDNVTEEMFRSDIIEHRNEAIKDADAGMFHSAIFELRTCIRLTENMWDGKLKW